MENSISRIIVVSERCKPLTQAMYGWSKHGGVNLGLVQEKLGDEWICQACSETQSVGQPFDFEFMPREFIKICESCHTVGVENEVTLFSDLIMLVRKLDPLFY